MDDLREFNNEELFELYEKVEEELKKLNGDIIVESDEEEEVEEDA